MTTNTNPADKTTDEIEAEIEALRKQYAACEIGRSAFQRRLFDLQYQLSHKAK
jgi:hypothetical protein